MIPPGATIGVLGGGQLGRMFAQAASRMGYRVHVFEPNSGSPAGEVAVKEVNAAFDDVAALSAFAAECAVVTYEFENVPVAPLLKLPKTTLLRPDPEILRTTQNRLREKTWLKANDVPHSPFAESGTAAGVAEAAAAIGFPCVIKTADFGYDGKGQLKLQGPADAAVAEKDFAGKGWVIEEWVDFACEISVIVARGGDGMIETFPVVENEHANHILSRSMIPARVDRTVENRAREIAITIAKRFELVGVLAVEMFVTRAGEVLVNEIAPRTHNSGHFSIEACTVSQFEQQVRAVCGLPLGKPQLREPTVMVNMLGDVWQSGVPDWKSLLQVPGLSLHLYGKKQPRPGRKMGHFSVSRPSVTEALAIAERAYSRLTSKE